jgi:hypothetical protein
MRVAYYGLRQKAVRPVIVVIVPDDLARVVYAECGRVKAQGIVNGLIDPCAINETMDAAGVTVLAHDLTFIVDPERVSSINPQRII